MKLNAISMIGATTVLAAAIASVFAAAEAAPKVQNANPLRIGMLALGDGNVEVTVTNASRKTARIPKWQLPSAVAESNLFAITHDGEEIRYEGRMIKRTTPTAADFAILRPGQSHRVTLNLAEAYDLSRAGDYTITFAAPLQFASMSGGTQLKQTNGLPMVAQSAPMRVWMEGGATTPTERLNQAAAEARKANVSPTAVVNGVNYVGCTSARTTSAGTAVNSARTYATNAKGYLNAGTTGPRYTSWFGAYTSSRYNTAKQHFTSISTAINQNAGQITINCGCSQNYYAYVYPTQPYQIYVCNAFWSAPNTGTDSKAGTLIHEMSHFNVVAATDDWAYGQSAAKSLATSNPTRALDNADNHEYFSENTPAQN
ncbi:MAG: M35 family metallo-endopeptidase [Lysobacteraceae bacterium]